MPPNERNERSQAQAISVGEQPTTNGCFMSDSIAFAQSHGVDWTKHGLRT